MFNWWWNLIQSDQLDDQQKEVDALKERIVQLEARCDILEQWIKYLDEVKK